MSLNTKVRKALEKIGSLSITTLDQTESTQPTMHSRIISICGSDDNGIYFLTMNVKPFYRQLKANPLISMCGIYPSSQKIGKNAAGQPIWAPGFTLRITGQTYEIPEKEVKAKADNGSEIHKYFLEDAGRYPAIRFFCIYKGKGEIYDFDFEMDSRNHKLLRARFAFGGEAFNDAGSRINPDECIACGECAETCTFKAIIPGEPYRIDGSRCDECGSCFEVCPQGAVEFSLTI